MIVGRITVHRDVRCDGEGASCCQAT